MKFFLLSICSVFMVLSSLELRAQNASVSEKKQFADNMMGIGEFKLALEIYEDLLKNVTPSSELYYRIGVCTTEEYDEVKALKHFEKAKELGSVKSLSNQLTYDKYNKRFNSHNIDFNLARGYHRLTRFAKAIKFYKLYLLNELDLSDRLDAEKMLAEAKNGWYLKKESSFKGRVTNLGGPLNTAYSEYGALVLEDSSSIIFTREQPNNHPRSTRPDGTIKEDVYVVTKRQSGGWFEPVRIDPNINSDTKGDKAIALSDNDSRLILQYKNGHFFESVRREDGWSVPVKLPKFINSPSKETGLAFGKNLLIVSSNRPSSYGGQDLFVSYRDDKGEWGYLEQLDSVINSPYDEISPYIDTETNTLYFSSNGHNTMGGYDVFRALYDPVKKTWGKPGNLGYPLNTPEDEVYFSYSSLSKKGFYSSNRRKGFGKHDIYKIDFDDNTRMETAVVKGKIYSSEESNKPLTATVKIREAKARTIVIAEKTSSETGFFSEKLVVGQDYLFSIHNDGYFHLDTVITVTPSTRLKLSLRPINEGELISLSAVSFERGKADISVESFDELNKFYEVLLANPLLGLEIAGHTEIGGIASQNMELSQKRADAVKDYYINKGIDKGRLLSVGYGSRYPLSKVADKAGANRRTEIILHRMDIEDWQPFYK